ncbi:hypothetical protein BABINDRAFT_43579 [Babjeviella inositovora NRRL Y-12698]|uniref:Palmitoyltransferase PFA4 n=1 Tax=Babjeviella inositovora NRRL Y-12698 TaxID=984486 RepID=A0A1E3QYB8_9ASCO|nr:uncharacterized protein BABINDRAFT_43579 [Babjeviella inositovora NRRL Y-12698]ODQ82635.1 hypothetical protein BABINDRAFT_43579 [Babjeviella inositovora NRRL Y-12698]
MAVSFKWPWLGVAIPCLLIASIGYGSHFFVFRKHFSVEKQMGFQLALSMIWLSYYLAIKKSPGSPPQNFKPVKGEWRRWCKKCRGYKPERTHHCKTCRTCVLKMDHHCPWTYNCVGFGNYAHFIRFLVWVDVTTFFVMCELFKRGLQFYHDRAMPAYLYDIKELTAVMVFLLLDFLVLFTVGILTIRCLYNIATGYTQIESWERERIDSQIQNGRIWKQISKNYEQLHGKKMPKLVSWNASWMAREAEASREVERDDDEPEVDSNFCIDDIIFPYDVSFFGNMTATLGPFHTWMLPWGGPTSNGLHFKKNEYVDDDQLGLPWPADGGHQEKPEEDIMHEITTRSGKVFRRKWKKDPRENLSRKEWFNDFGETLNDFGVDVEAEDEENDELIR